MSLRIKDFIETEAEEATDEECKEKRLSINEEENSIEGEIIQDLIDDQNIHPRKLNKSHKEIRNKFLNDELEKDEKEIKEILSGAAIKRKWTNTRKDKDTDDSHLNDKKLKREHKPIQNLSKFKLKITSQEEDSTTVSNEDEEAEGINELLYQYENKIKKEIVENSKEYQQKFNQRLKENEEILSNVINLNNKGEESRKRNKEGRRNIFFPCAQNSILNAIKKDKYYNNENENEKKVNTNSRTFHIFQKDFPIDSDKKIKVERIFQKTEVHTRISIRENKD